MAIGDEDYARYYYLWHLIAIGVLKVPTTDDDGNPVVVSPEGCPPIESAVWDGPTNRTPRIGLIDMGIARYHPNLEPPEDLDSQIDWENSLDLASHPFGARYVKLSDVLPVDRHLEQRQRFLNNIPDGAAMTASFAGLSSNEEAVIDQIKEGFGVVRYVRTYNERYSGHGTCCAGLTSGTSYDVDQFGMEGNIAAYYGVDPFSRVVPITTSISPNPKQLIAAFLYAYSQQVEVILVPRDAADPTFWPAYGSLSADEKTRLHETAASEPDGDKIEISASWALLTKVIEWVSKEIPVVCAAGNDGRSELIYPASLSGDTTNGVISVGAVSYRGYRSGYSNYSQDLTVVAPSDDGEVYNRHQIRLDRKAASATDFWVDGVHKKPVPPFDAIPTIPYSAPRLLSLDVPGARGYVEGSTVATITDRQMARDDPSSLYTQFGGTSGASALVAGVVALMQRQAINKLTGVEVKNLFEGLANDPNRHDTSHWYWQSGQSELQIDSPNDYNAPSLDELFGRAGLLNAGTMLSLV